MSSVTRGVGERPAAIVLAGGASRRFGEDKLAAELDGRPVLAHALDAVRGLADPVVVVLAPDAPVPVAARGCTVARDPAAFGGPLAGIVAGLVALPAPWPDIAVVVGGDMPSLVPDVLALLVTVLAADPSLGAVTLAAEPAAILPMGVRPGLVLPAGAALIAADRRRLRDLLTVVPSVVVPEAIWRAIDPDGATLRDVDVPGDLGSG